MMSPLERKACDVMVSPCRLSIIFNLHRNQEGLSVEALNERREYKPCHSAYEHIEEMKSAHIIEQHGLYYKLTPEGEKVFKTCIAIAKAVDI